MKIKSNLYHTCTLIISFEFNSYCINEFGLNNCYNLKCLVFFVGIQEKLACLQNERRKLRLLFIFKGGGGGGGSSKILTTKHAEVKLLSAEPVR